jgi:hypothetical protein
MIPSGTKFAGRLDPEDDSRIFVDLQNVEESYLT